MSEISGVEILNTVTEMPEKSGSMIVMYVLFAAILLACAGMCVYAMYETYDKHYMDVTDRIGLIILFLIFVGCCVGDYFLVRAAFGEKDKRETIVYATIDDSVPWSAINDQYELVRKDGKIYQLRVKEDRDE